MVIDEQFVPADGWRLHLKRVRDPHRLDPNRRPLLIVPGYGMNSFIFGFHPHGTSMERCFAEAGVEVWSANLRGQGLSRKARFSPPPPSLRRYAEQDLHAIVEAIVSRTRTSARRVDVIGASLGGSIAYAYMALRPEHRVGSLVTIGAPLRWVDVHPALRFAFKSPRVAGMIPFYGTRSLARAAFPLLARFPALLSIYMNTSHVDLTAAADLTRTVENPHPSVNSDIAKWIRDKDMTLRGINITHAMGRSDRPLLIVVANRDGIVPEAATLSARDYWGGADVSVLRIGDDAEWFAHADLFIANQAAQAVFAPIMAWLAARH
ncbi:MAG: alpha/beta fold hydrolase [Candidatus Schekmanbacteria bacterium]|nr:alpha/beta fold hydrolase [Candidatus Schekmanbacteria bacterium]